MSLVSLTTTKIFNSEAKEIFNIVGIYIFDLATANVYHSLRIYLPYYRSNGNINM